MNLADSHTSKALAEEQEAENVITIKDLKIAFGQQEVLKGISFELKKEENLVVLGKSGSGKSVLIKCISGLLSPDEGTILVLGEDVTRLKARELAELRKKIGFLFQSGALYDSMNVRSNLEFPLKRMKRNISKEELDMKVHEVLQNVGLEHAIDKMPSELSGGMRKRIALARTIIADPLIMLYDEPTTGLDPITSGEISELINKVREKYKTSSIVITHDLPCARQVADRVIILKEGLVHAEGTLDELEQKDDEWMKLFLGKGK